MAPPSTTLPEELVEEFLLHFTPDEPACLFRASAVCKPWCRFISGPGFRRRYRDIHRSPPLLGLICGIPDSVDETASFVPTSAFCSLPADLRRCRAIDAHHGRVLLRCPGKASTKNVLVVWDPISDERKELRNPSRWQHDASWDWNAAVLCAAAGLCDHLDCRRGPFLVVYINSRCFSEIFISTYCSDTGTWSDRIFLIKPFSISICLSPCAHVGNALYFVSKRRNTVLKYDFSLHEISVIQLPPTSIICQLLVLASTEDGGLVTATINKFKLYIWSRKDGPQVDAGWTQTRVIDIEMPLQSSAILTSVSVVGFVNGIHVVLFSADNVIFTVDLKTKNLKKLSRGKIMYNVLPYMSFYTPALGAASGGEGPAVIGSDA